MNNQANAQVGAGALDETPRDAAKMDCSPGGKTWADVVGTALSYKLPAPNDCGLTWLSQMKSLHLDLAAAYERAAKKVAAKKPKGAASKRKNAKKGN